MVGYSKKETIKSLKEGISLVENKQENKACWATYEELTDFYTKGFVLINEQKKRIYENA